ncbi:hypothetical protein FHG87_009683 [Trinorchestia longiramus]|nr:hypothetical protein FHG87_009683 [Trinorchestia longiramus]
MADEEETTSLTGGDTGSIHLSAVSPKPPNMQRGSAEVRGLVVVLDECVAVVTLQVSSCGCGCGDPTSQQLYLW